MRHYTHFVDEETNSEKVNGLSSVFQLGSDRAKAQMRYDLTVAPNLLP